VPSLGVPLAARHLSRALDGRSQVTRHESLLWTRLAVLVAIGAFTIGLPHVVEAAMPTGCPDDGAKVFLSAHGVVTLNGRQVEASKLIDALMALSPKPTVVCYSREAPQGEPHESMKVVLDAIIAMRLPIGLFTDATFKTAVRPD
jgi:hypothetical protein